MKELIIQKFGGTSIGLPKNVKNIKDIILKYDNFNQILVFSAFSKITDLLIKLNSELKNNNFENASITLTKINNIHLDWIKQLAQNEYQKDKMNAQLSQLIEQIRTIIQGVSIIQELSQSVEKRIIAFGEMLSSSLFFIYIQYELEINLSFINAIEVIEKKQDEIVVNTDLIFEEFIHSQLIITQGFICIENGKISNLGRGGSDYSASIIGAEISAKEINIWTDVNGILTASPLYFPDAESLRFISYHQIRELAKYGAKVLHLDTILPAIKKQIDVKILNTSNIDFEGTIISNNKLTKKFSISKLDNIDKITIDNSKDEKYLLKILNSVKKINKSNFNFLELFSNIDKTDIYFSNKNENSNYSIICIVNPSIRLIINELSGVNFTFDSENMILKIFVSSELSEKLLNLIYTKLKNK